MNEFSHEMIPIRRYLLPFIWLFQIYCVTLLSKYGNLQITANIKEGKGDEGTIF